MIEMKEGCKMLGFIVLFVLFVSLIKLTWFLLSMTGKALGFVIGMAGYLLLGFIAVSVLGLATLVFPLVLVAGAISLIAGLAR